jgi:hypothetical protein
MLGDGVGQFGFILNHVLFRPIAQRDYSAVHAHRLQRVFGRDHQPICDQRAGSSCILPDIGFNCAHSVDPSPGDESVLF